eukprot:PhF_6_TR4163/c0_g1_i1/m.5591
MSGPRAYLAGPDVFFPNPIEVGNQKKLLCTQYGCIGSFPMDKDLDLSQYQTKQEMGFAISIANEHLMRSCDCIIANLTPYRGVSADVGTAFEVGFMRALGKPIFAYSNVKANFSERVRKTLPAGFPVEVPGDHSCRDHEGYALE